MRLAPQPRSRSNVVTGWIGFAIAGRDNRIDREQVGQAQQIAQQLLDRDRGAGDPPPGGPLPSPTFGQEIAR